MLIPKISIPTDLRAKDVPQLFLTLGVAYHEVACVDWPEGYPYCPKMEVALAHAGDRLLVHYRVSERCIRAAAPADGGHVWEDSCCELFLQPVEGGPYYNFECNCGGTLLLAAGEGRYNRQPATKELMQQVDRWSSLAPEAKGGGTLIALDEGDHSWHMALIIPAVALFQSDVATFDGCHMRGNIYKCGDALSVPHFLSLYPISTPQPDFHRPEFFQELRFA